VVAELYQAHKQDARNSRQQILDQMRGIQLVKRAAGAPLPPDYETEPMEVDLD